MLVFMWADVAQFPMSSFSIVGNTVEDFDIPEQAKAGLFASPIVLPMHLLFFEGGKEALSTTAL